MALTELINRSPIRIFEKSINGELNQGEIGVIASPKGVGKTSVLVQLALDKLFQEKKVIHVSFAQHTQYMMSWYEDIFNEFITKKNIQNAANIINDLVKNRVQMNFNQGGVTKEQILKSLRAMIVDGGFEADVIIIDGFDFSQTSRECIAGVKTFAKDLGLSVWYSCSLKDDDSQYDKNNIPVVIGPFVDLIDVVVALQPKSDHVELSISKDREPAVSKSMAMKLDPKTLLILEA
ncbi:MAG: hypothetical protein FWC97_04080 [Treponema sp.]|nr:hypothetical protein [Treponema sp.]